MGYIGNAYGLHRYHYCIHLRQFAMAAMTKPATDLDRAWFDSETGAHQKRGYTGQFMRL